MKALFRRKTLKKQWDKSGSLNENNTNSSNNSMEESTNKKNTESTIRDKSPKLLQEVVTSKKILNHVSDSTEKSKISLLIRAKSENVQVLCELKSIQQKYQDMVNLLSMEQIRNENLNNILNQVELLSQMLARQGFLIQDKAAALNAEFQAIEQKM